MEYDPTCEDPTEIDARFPPSIEHVIIRSKGCDMLGVLFGANGEGPHPAVIILHGFPGHERNLDLAHVLRRAGYDVLVFHYRGAWGSEGMFSFSNVMEDVSAAVDHMRERAGKAEGGGSRRLVLMGHSMGGWAALLHGARDANLRELIVLAPFNFGLIRNFADDPLAIGGVKVMMKEMVRPLNCYGVDGLISDLVEGGERFDPLNCMDALRGKRILFVTADKDTTSSAEMHTEPLLENLRESGIDTDHIVVPSDHSFSYGRIALARAVLHWLDESP